MSESAEPSQVETISDRQEFEQEVQGAKKVDTVNVTTKRFFLKDLQREIKKDQLLEEVKAHNELNQIDSKYKNKLKQIEAMQRALIRPKNPAAAALTESDILYQNQIEKMRDLNALQMKNRAMQR